MELNNVLPYEDGYKLLNDYLISYNLTNIKNDFLGDYTIAYKSIKKIKAIKEIAYNESDFKSLLSNSKSAFFLLNDYQKNAGNLKLYKRMENLEKYFLKYVNNEKIPMYMDNYFNEITNVKLPTTRNILTIIKHNFLMSINYIQRDKVFSLWVANNLIFDLFGVKKFRSDLRYKIITINNNKLFSLYYGNNYKMEEKYKSYNFNIT